MFRLRTGVRSIVATALLAWCSQGMAFGWGATGHRIVAAIGENHLSDAARAGVSDLAGDMSLAQIATWPDFIRSESQWNCSQPWHFLTVEDWETTEEAARGTGEFRNCKLPELPDGSSLPQNVVQAIDFFSAILQGNEEASDAFERLADANSARFLNDSLELSALSFLVHLIGDVHQPLHVGRGQDRGGNKVWVNWFGELSNLHSSWDEGLIAAEKLSYTEFVAFLEAAMGSADDFGSLSDTLAWADESRKARFQVYQIYADLDYDNHLPDLSYQYAHDQSELLEQRLYRGGRRAAARLNAIFSGAR